MTAQARQFFKSFQSHVANAQSINRSIARLAIASVRTTVLLLAGILTAQADMVPVGYFTYSSFIPAGAGPGVNRFSIANLTSDPATGGYALEPDFPFFSQVLLNNASLTLLSSSVEQEISLGTLAAGFHDQSSLEFPETKLFQSATFRATIAGGTYRLFNGSFASVADQQISAILRPAFGENLQADIDLQILEIDARLDEATVIPEPASFLPLAATVLGVLYMVRRRGRV
jgi:hypothetical protein